MMLRRSADPVRNRLVPVTTRTHWGTMTRITLIVAGLALLLAGCEPTADAGKATSPSTSASVAVAPSSTAPAPPATKAAAVRKPPTAKPAAAAKPPTVAQQQALESAQSYIDMSGFSRKGLLRQLTSKAADGFSTADATWAVDHVKVDWNAEAVESAKSYLEMGGFSRASLQRQLTSSAGDGYTKAQAQYAVKKVGL